MKAVLAIAACAAALSINSGAVAQTYPTRPVIAIVPASAGGPTDTIARIIAERMSASLGANVVIENVGGASGTIGTGRVVRAPPDGYTIGIGGWNHYVVNAGTYPNLPYDLLKDFEPIAQLASGPQIILSKKSLPANNLKELMAWLKTQPAVTMATGGVGAPGACQRHVAAERTRRELPVRALSRLRPGAAGRRRRPSRHDHRADLDRRCRRSAAARSRPMR